MEELKFKETENIDSKLLEKTIIENNQIASKIRKSIINLKKMEIENSCNKSEVHNNDRKDDNQKVSRDSEDNYDFYYAPILKIQDRDLTNQELFDKINNYLPAYENSDENIIYRIKIEIIKNIQELELLSLNEEDIEMLEEIKQEIAFNQRKLETINKITMAAKNHIEITKKENRIIFLETSSSNYTIINELKVIPSEYYDSFKELFDSIIDGTFKNLRSLTTTNKKINGISEVKNFKTRILFDRIDENTFIILSIFMKKFDTNKQYLDSLGLTVTNYRNSKKYYEECIKSEEYMMKQEELKNELFCTLNHNKVKKLGEWNG